MNVYILTEITKREIDSNLFLACNAVNHGFNVLISNHEIIKLLNDKKLLKAGIFHTKSLVHGDKKRELHDALKTNKIKISSIDEEAGLVLKDLTSFSKARFTEDDLEVADKIFCWGKDDYENLAKLFNNSKNKLFLSGSHRFDMMLSKFDNYWNNSNLEKKKITISGNFNLVNGYTNKDKIILELNKQGYFSRSEIYKDELINILDDTEKKFKEFFKMIRYIIERFPDETFHLRPHPLEKIETWKNEFSNFKNVNVSKKGNINEQLVNSKILIHNSCTTAFHSYFYGIPTISYEPIVCKSDYGQPANELSERTKKVEELCNLISTILENKYTISNKNYKDDLFNNKVFRPKNNYSAEIIVNEWKKISNFSNENQINLRKIKYELFINEIFNNLRKIAIKIIKPFKKLYSDKKFEDLDEIEVTDKIKKIQKILNIRSEIMVKKIANKCFFLKKNDKSD